MHVYMDKHAGADIDEHIGFAFDFKFHQCLSILCVSIHTQTATATTNIDNIFVFVMRK